MGSNKITHAELIRNGLNDIYHLVNYMKSYLINIISKQFLQTY